MKPQLFLPRVGDAWAAVALWTPSCMRAGLRAAEMLAVGNVREAGGC